MDRQIVYAGAIPQDTDILKSERNAMIALGYAIQGLLGVATMVDGLACTPTSPATMAVNVAPGAIYSMAPVDVSAYGSLAADTSHSIMKQGLSLNTVTLNTPAPLTTGYSVVYLIQVAYLDVDGGSVVLPYYNASNPASAYSGPNNSGAANYTIRQGVCSIQVKTGVAAPTGTQQVPAVDAGYTALYTVTVANSDLSVTSGMISKVSGAPFITVKLSQLGTLATENIGQGLEDNGSGSLQVKLADTSLRRTSAGLQTNEPLASISTSQSITSGNHFSNLVATAGLTLTLPLNTGLWNGFCFGIYASGGVVVLTPNGADKINNGTTGASLTIAQGSSCFVLCDANHNWWTWASMPSIASILGPMTFTQQNYFSNGVTPTVALDALDMVQKKAMVVPLTDVMMDPDCPGLNVQWGSTVNRKAPAVRLADGAQQGVLGLASLLDNTRNYQLVIECGQSTSSAGKAIVFKVELQTTVAGQDPARNTALVSDSQTFATNADTSQILCTNAAWQITAAQQPGPYTQVRVGIWRMGADGSDTHTGATNVFRAYLKAV